MSGLTKQDIARFAPRPKSGTKAQIYDGYVEAFINDGATLFEENGIDTALEFQHFMAQIAHESGGFTILWESGAYSAEGIMRIFGKGVHSAGVTTEEAREIGALPMEGDQRAKALFERVYGLGNPKKAKELGNTEPGDGYRYRGWGLIQLTGGTDHKRLIGDDYSYTNALRVALIEFGEKGCHKLASHDDVKGITRRINGGFNGLQDRKDCLARAKRCWPEFPCAVDEGEDLPALEPVVKTESAPAPVAETSKSQEAVEVVEKKSIMESKTAQGSAGSSLASGYIAQAEVKRTIASAKGPDGFDWGKFLIDLLTSEIFIGAVIAVGLAVYVIFDRRSKKDIKK